MAGNYPPVDDNFRSFLNGFRCEAVHDGRRCQLYSAHDDPHAHAWLEPKPRGYARSSRQPYPWRPHLERWDEERSWIELCGVERLHWCCMFTD